MRPTLILVFFIIVAASPAISQSGDSKVSKSGSSEGYFRAADGVRLFYRKVGSGKNLIVLLHGGPGSNMNAVWPDLKPLANKHTVLMYDQRGGGRSEIIKDPNRLKYTDHVRDLEALRKQFGLERMVLVGESWGAGLAALYAMEHPHRVSRLLLLGPFPPSRALITRRLDKTDERIDFSKRLAQFRSALPTASDPIALCQEFFRVYRAALFFDQTAASRRRGSSCDAPPEGVRNYMVVNDATFGSLGEYDLLPKLRQLRMPALIVEGEQSMTTLESVRAWAEAMPNARLLLIPKSGHFPQVEQPHLFFPAVEGFLRGSWPATATITREAAVKSGQKRGVDEALNTDAEQEVMAVMRRYVEAYGQNNVVALDGILAVGFVFTSSRGIVVTKAQELSDIRSGEMKTESASVDELQVRIRGNAAVVTGRATLKGVWRGQDFSGQYRVTATWVREEGHWRLLAEHASRIAQQ